MYEVEFFIDDSGMTKLFEQARIEVGGDPADGGFSIGQINGRVWNAVGAPPARPLGFNPSYDQGARGPTPRVTPFTVERLTTTFPAFIVQGNDGPGTRHFLNQNIVNFLSACVELNARRPDLQPQATIGILIRGLFEENEANDANLTSAVDLYNYEDEYPSVNIVYAGGDNSNYSVAYDVLRRPRRTKINNYAATP